MQTCLQDVESSDEARLVNHIHALMLLHVAHSRAKVAMKKASCQQSSSKWFGLINLTRCSSSSADFLEEVINETVYCMAYSPIVVDV